MLACGAQAIQMAKYALLLPPIAELFQQKTRV